MLKTSRSKLGLLLSVLLLTVAVYGCSSPTETVQFRKYILSGHVNIVNNCTNNMSDMPETLDYKATFHYTDGEKHELSRIGKAVNPVKGTVNEKFSMFMFRVETNKFGDNWEITSISRSSGGGVCSLIECTTGAGCMNTTENNLIIPAEDPETKSTNISKHFTYTCEYEDSK